MAYRRRRALFFYAPCRLRCIWGRPGHGWMAGTEIRYELESSGLGKGFPSEILRVLSPLGRFVVDALRFAWRQNSEWQGIVVTVPN